MAITPLFHRLCGDLSIGWMHYSLLVLFWVSALVMKGVFDYYVLWKVGGRCVCTGESECGS